MPVDIKLSSNMSRRLSDFHPSKLLIVQVVSFWVLSNVANMHLYCTKAIHRHNSKKILNWHLSLHKEFCSFDVKKARNNIYCKIRMSWYWCPTKKWILRGTVSNATLLNSILISYFCCTYVHKFSKNTWSFNWMHRRFQSFLIGWNLWLVYWIWESTTDGVEDLI